MAAPADQSIFVTRPAAPPCHVGAIPIFQVGKATLWAGSYRQIWDEPRPWKMMICCAGHSYAPSDGFVFTSVNVPEALRRMNTTTPFVSIEWPDGSIPPVNRMFWHTLTDVLANIQGDVGVYCFGGHGRTGTAISILAALSGAVPKDEDPVKWLRDRYCREAVETTQQVRYIEEVTGHEVNATPSFMMNREWVEFIEQFNATHAADEKNGRRYPKRGNKRSRGRRVDKR